MDIGNVTIFNPRGPRHGAKASEIGTVGLVWLPAAWVRLHVENSWKDKESGEYEHRDVAEICRVGEIRCDFADVRLSAKGQVYLSIRNLAIPWDIQVALGTMAAEKIRRRESAAATLASGDAVDPDDFENDRMKTGEPMPGSMNSRRAAQATN